jgi:hypothetical protein
LLTVKLWGGEPTATHLSAAVGGETINTQARVSEPNQDGRFFYVTIAIPTEHTNGQEAVEVTFTAGDAGPDHVYAAYTHAENFYAPPEDEVQGEPLEAPKMSDPDFDVMRENLLAAADAGIDQTKAWQNDDESSRTYGNIRSWGGNRQARGSGNFLRAYKTEGSKYHGDEEMIDRALRSFDFYCRYQGYRGTLKVFWGKREWIGGPDRSGIGGGLPGFMATYLGRSFMEAIPIFRERPELLEEEIDANADGEANTTRREAYTRFWRDYLWENMLPRHGIAQKVYNQVTVNGTSMLLANEVLKFLSPEDAAPDHIMTGQARAKAGLLPIEDDVVDFVLELQTRNEGEYGKAPGSLDEGRYYESKHWHWSATRHYYPLSPKGIGVEFGYDPAYSLHTKNIYLDKAANDHRISDQVRRYFDGTQHVIYPTGKQTGNRWSVVGAIGSRNPGRQWTRFGGSKVMHAALNLDIEPARRILREQLRSVNDFADLNLSFSDSHVVRMPLTWLEYLPTIREWYENEESTDYRLPAEREGLYAWADEMTGLVMIHDTDGTHYLENMYPRTQKRYHRITDEYRAFGDAKSEFCHAAHLETARVGPYEIAMNRSNHRDVRVEGGPRPHRSSIDGDSAVDIVTGDAVDTSGDVLIDPDRTLVLDSRRQGDAGSGPGQPELATASMDERTRRIHWEWSIPEGCADMAALNLPLADDEATARVAEYYKDAVSRGTRQHANQVPTFYRPDHFEAGTPISVSAGDGERLKVETVDGCRNRLVVDQPENDVSGVEATGILPTFDTYDDWVVEAPGFSGDAVRTDDALAVELAGETEVNEEYPLTFTLDLAQPVERIVFLHESSFDRSALRTVLETDDGRTLWRGTHPEELTTPDNRNAPKTTDELVNLEGKHVEGALHFRVRQDVASESMNERWYHELTDGVKMATDQPTTVGDGWYRRISNVRIEYADGTAVYPHP